MDCVMSVTGTVPQRPGQDSRAVGWLHKGVCQLPDGVAYTEVFLHIHLPISSNIGPSSPVVSIKVIICTEMKQVQIVPRRRKSCSACCCYLLFPFERTFLGGTYWGVMQREKGRWHSGFSSCDMKIRQFSFAQYSWSSLVLSCAPLPRTSSMVHWCLDYHVWGIPTYLPRHQLIQRMINKGHQRPYFCLLSWVTCWFFWGLDLHTYAFGVTLEVWSRFSSWHSVLLWLRSTAVD